MPTTVLICDDDPVQRRLLEGMSRKFGHDVLIATNGEEAITLLLSDAGSGIDVIVLDLVMPDLDGMGVLGKMRELGIAKPTIVQTSTGGIDTVVSAMRAGACDFVVKPVGAERLQVSIQNAIKTGSLEVEIQRMKRRKDGTLTFKDIISHSPRMVPVLKAAQKAATSTIPVLIEGESGVGKELIARAIAGSGDRKGKPFVAVNCGAIPANLVESILFGHEKGAFTGATDKHVGKFVEAHGGTLFLDEVGELTPETQVKLLRAIQEGEVDPVGAKKPIKVDIRLISATNRDLIAAVKEGRFREDLYYRICVFPVMLPPLRNRREDVPDLVRHFLTRITAEEGRKIRSISAEAMQLLTAYQWPGNVRQLENTVFRAVVLCDTDELTVGDFPQIAVQMDNFVMEIPAIAALSPDGPGQSMPVSASPLFLDAPPVVPAVSQPAMIVPNSALNLLRDDGHLRPMEELEADIIRFAITHYGGQMSSVARRLGIGRSTLYRRVSELGIAADLSSDDA